MTHVGGPRVIQVLYRFAPPTETSPLAGRLFGVWNLLSTVVRIYSAYEIHNEALYNLAMLTFVIALLHFGIEVFGTGTARGWHIVAAETTPVVSLTWMMAQKRYYIG